MRRTSSFSLLRLALAVGLTLSLVSVAACGHDIGDSCEINVDCDPRGTRFCDTASPGGYCTQQGCDYNTCPGEAVCIRFFTQVLDQPCTFDQLNPDAKSNCPYGNEFCICDELDKNGNCPSAHCAPETSERRWCMLKCSHNSDCRTDYECRETGTEGAETVPSFSNPSPAPARFCAPNP